MLRFTKVSALLLSLCALTACAGREVLLENAAGEQVYCKSEDRPGWLGWFSWFFGTSGNAVNQCVAESQKTGYSIICCESIPTASD